MGTRRILVALVGAVLLAPLAGAATLNVNSSAAMAGTNYGLEMIMDGTTHGSFVRDDTPNDEVIYRAQFWFNPNTWNGPEGATVILARTTDETLFYAPFQVLLTKKSGLWRVYVRAQNNTGVVRFTNRINLTPGTPSLLQVEWVKGDVPGTLSGDVTLSVLDGAAAGQSVATGLNNSNIYADNIVLGALQPQTTQTGSYYFDEFASFRTLAP